MINGPFNVFNDVPDLNKHVDGRMCTESTIRYVNPNCLNSHSLSLIGAWATRYLYKMNNENYFPVCNFLDEANDSISTARDQTHVLWKTIMFFFSISTIFNSLHARFNSEMINYPDEYHPKGAIELRFPQCRSFCAWTKYLLFNCTFESRLDRRYCRLCAPNLSLSTMRTGNIRRKSFHSVIYGIVSE